MFSESCIISKYTTFKIYSIFILDVIERTVNVTMEMNEPFTDEHKDPSSEEYKIFVKRFNETVSTVV